MKILDKKYLSKFKEFDNHEKVVEINDKGLHAFIAIHNTNLGPAVGGTRFYPYNSKDDALVDVLRLARGMTYKCAISRVSFGGGKAVIIADPKTSKKDDLLKKYAQSVGLLKGQFYTGEDVGITESDVQKMLLVSPYFIGKSTLAGDPSPYASLSTYLCMKVISKHLFGTTKLKGLKIAIKGTGKVGGRLAELVSLEGAKLYIADIDNSKTLSLRRKSIHFEKLDPKEIHQAKVDIYSPCAMGGEFTTKTMHEVKAKVICGAANNQLVSNEIGDWFYSQNILYAPDYIVNAGGLINVVDELETSGYTKQRVLKRIKRVAHTLKTILNISTDENMPTNRIADSFAEGIFKTSRFSQRYLFT